MRKKIRGHVFQAIEDKFRFIEERRRFIPVEKICRISGGPRSGCYAWLTRPISMRKRRNQTLLREIVRLHVKYPSLGLDGLYHILRRKRACSRGRVHRLMKKAGIHSIRKAGFKVTTNSRHKLPIAPNLLNRNFLAATPDAVLVSDITYIRTGQGWLYLAIIKDLCTKKVVGYALSSRIDTDLVRDALRMAIRRQKPVPGLIFHSDRGIQRLRALSLRPPRCGLSPEHEPQGGPLRQRRCGEFLQLP